MILSLLVICSLIILPTSTASHLVQSTCAPTPQLYVPQSGWEPIDSGVTQDLNCVSFVCLNRGSIAGNGGIILRTGDGGDNWTTQNTGVGENLYDISYLDYSIILAVGASGTILFTDDYGQNWTVVQTGMMGAYYSGQMITETVGIAVGVNAIFQPFVTRTDDAWATSESTSFYIEYQSVLYEGRLSDVYFMNTSVGYATAVVDVPAGGAIVRTVDGGSTWETVYFSDDALYGLDFTWEGAGYAVGDHGTILQTLDNGDTWDALDSGVDSILRSIDFCSDVTGAAVGDGGVILKTEDGGTTWTSQMSGTTAGLRSVRFITRTIGLAVGEDGLILRTTSGGYTDASPPQTTCTLSGVIQDDVYISDVTVTLTATDDGSGVESTSYKLDDDLWTIYTEPFLVSSDGAHVLRFYSTDYVGNTEAEQTISFIIAHPPPLTITITGGFGLTVTVKNSGSMDIDNASWQLTLDGGFILIGKQKSGITNITAGGEILLRRLAFGIGSPTITFTIGDTETSVQARVFLFFIRIQ